MAEASPIALDDLQPGDELLQERPLGTFQGALRLAGTAAAVEGRLAAAGTLLALTRSTPLGPLTYVPGGPASPAAPAAAARLLELLAPEIALQGWVFRDSPPLPRPAVVRYDLPWPVAEGSPALSPAGHLYRAPVDVQPTSTVLVGLLGDEEGCWRG